MDDPIRPGDSDTGKRVHAMTIKAKRQRGQAGLVLRDSLVVLVIYDSTGRPIFEVEPAYIPDFGSVLYFYRFLRTTGEREHLMTMTTTAAKALLKYLPALLTEASQQQG
jgi:hypothetical protein